MELITLDSSLSEVSSGQIAYSRALEELEQINAKGSSVFESEADALPATQFTLSRNKQDFLTVQCHSQGEIHFTSDQLVHSGSWWKRLFVDKVFQFRCAKPVAELVIRHYFELSREAFEDRYSEGLTHSGSLAFVELKG